MTTWRRHRTTVDSITGQLVGIATLATAASVTGRCRNCHSGEVVTLPGVIDDAANRIVTLDLTAWLPTAELGPWDLTWHPVFMSGATPIWPEEPATDQIVVLA